jgi:hypothetical protein
VSNLLRLSYSQIATFKRCRKKWYYRYVDGIVPKVDPKPIIMGRYGHRLLEVLYRKFDGNNDANDIIEKASQEYWEKKTANLFSEELEEFKEVRQKVEKIIKKYAELYESDFRRLDILGVEEEFEVRIRTPRGNRSMTSLYGILDLIIATDSGIWLMDHKLTKSKDMRFEHALLDEQINMYTWALTEVLKQKGIHVPIKGFVINALNSKLPRRPSINKNGSVSRRRIKTTKGIYQQAVIDAGKDPADYQDMLDKLGDWKPDFYERQFSYRNPSELEQVGRELYEVSKAIREGRIYRTASPTQCSWDCSYKDLCTLEMKGGDVEHYKSMKFQEKE